MDLGGRWSCISVFSFPGWHVGSFFKVSGPQWPWLYGRVTSSIYRPDCAHWVTQTENTPHLAARTPVSFPFATITSPLQKSKCSGTESDRAPVRSFSDISCQIEWSLFLFWVCLYFNPHTSRNRLLPSRKIDQGFLYAIAFIFPSYPHHIWGDPFPSDHADMTPRRYSVWPPLFFRDNVQIFLHKSTCSSRG